MLTTFNNYFAEKPREGDDFQHRDISVTKVIVHTEEFPSYRESRDGHLYQILHLVDKERAAVLFKQDEYEPYISYSNRIKVVPLKSIQKDDFEFEKQSLEEDNEMER